MQKSTQPPTDSFPQMEPSATATEADPVSTAQSKRRKLVRQRGRRGGVKNRPKESKPATSSHSKKIAAFHVLEKQLAQTYPIERREILAEQKKLGGLEVYQNASLTGGDKLKGGESGKWCAGVLKETRGEAKMRLLDVGAISGTSYTKFPWIETTSIDLNPRGPNVLKYDFFDFPIPKMEEEKYDCVGLSLVINFVGDLKRRGDMLLHAHKYLKPRGYLYVVLPLPCLANSRYLNHEHFTDILDSTGWEVARQDDSKRLTRWFLRRKGNSKAWDGRAFKKEEIRGGVERNNFCIIVA